MLQRALAWLKSFTNQIASFKKQIASFTKKIAAHDPSSWASHWVICLAITIIAALIGGEFWGYVSSEILLVYFALREGLNYGYFQAQYDNYEHLFYVSPAKKKKKLKDGILDFTGPLVCHLLWWYAILG